MLDFTEFKNEFINGCRDELAGVARFSPYSKIELEEHIITKAQRGELTGLIFKEPGTICAPTFYVEDFYDLYKEGRSLKDLSVTVVQDAYRYIHNPPDFPDIDHNVLSGQCIFGVRLLNKSGNRNYLRDVTFLDAGCGFALIAEIRSGDFRAVITNSLMDSLGMTKEDLFERALEDSSMNDRATLYDLADMLPAFPEGNINLLDSKAGTVLPPVSLYVLSNESSFWGAAVLFYPGMMTRLNELMGGSFYVLPSSIHEVLLLPATEGDPQRLVDIIRSANRSVTDSDVFLADELFICESGRLKQVSYGGVVPSPGSFPC